MSFTFDLFRVRVVPSAQMNFTHKISHPSEILRQAVHEGGGQSLGKRTRFYWRIGDVQKLDSTGIYFQIGRMTVSTLDVFAEGRFQNMEFEAAPFTHAVLDTASEVLAIARKPKLSLTTSSIAHRIEKLLTRSKAAIEHGAEFEVSQINDPHELVEYLKKAYSVELFWMKFARPNPWDANKDLQAPLEKALQELGGKKGKVELRGSALDSKGLEDVTRAAAAGGQDAGASLRMTQKGKMLRRKLKGNPLAVHHDGPLKTPEERKELWDKIRGKHREARGL